MKGPKPHTTQEVRTLETVRNPLFFARKNLATLRYKIKIIYTLLMLVYTNGNI